MDVQERYRGEGFKTAVVKFYYEGEEKGGLLLHSWSPLHP
jgi:hypothetical protein